MTEGHGSEISSGGKNSTLRRCAMFFYNNVLLRTAIFSHGFLVEMLISPAQILNVK